MGIGAVHAQAMFSHAVATQLYAGSAENSISGTLLNSDPILQSLDAAQSTIVTQAGGVAALRTALDDLDEGMSAVNAATQKMAAGDTSKESVMALLDAMNQLGGSLDKHGATLTPRLRITLDEVVRLTREGLEGIGVTFDSRGDAALNEAKFGQALQSDPLAVADALYGQLGLAPGLAAMTEVYYSLPPAKFVNDEAIAALNPLNANGMSAAGMAALSGMTGARALPGMNATLSAYASTLPGPVQGALLSLLG